MVSIGFRTSLHRCRTAVHTIGRPFKYKFLVDNLNENSLLLLQPNMYLFEYIDLAPKCQFKVLTFIFFMGCVWVAFFSSKGLYCSYSARKSDYYIRPTTMPFFIIWVQS